MVGTCSYSRCRCPYIIPPASASRAVCRWAAAPRLGNEQGGSLRSVTLLRWGREGVVVPSSPPPLVRRRMIRPRRKGSRVLKDLYEAYYGGMLQTHADCTAYSYNVSYDEMQPPLAAGVVRSRRPASASGVLTMSIRVGGRTCCLFYKL